MRRPGEPGGAALQDTGTGPRALDLAGASNFRDLGGYHTADGRQVRWRLLYRSDQLAALAPDDVARLQALGIGRALDFRGEQECAAAAYAWPGMVRHALSIEPTVVQEVQSLLAAGRTLTAEDAELLMKQTYRHFVTDCQAQYRELFEHLLAGPGPLVFHCTAGKDRTGLAAALILRALGVPMAQVMEDYLLTNRLYKEPASVTGVLSPDVVAILWRVQPGFLRAALQVLEQDFGGMAAYLEQALGIAGPERQRLAELYLEPAR